MIYVGIDVAKNKHDCFITNSDGEILFNCFTIPNTMDGFLALYEKILLCSTDTKKVKVGLEATGHYSNNLLNFLISNNLAVYLINPLHSNLYRKSITLRKTKTDLIDCRILANMLMSESLIPYTSTSFHNEELKSLTRYRFDKVRERAALKNSIARLVSILFPELESLVTGLHLKVVYGLLSEFPGASYVARAHLTKLSNVVQSASHGKYTREQAITFRDAARSSIGSVSLAKSMELKHTISLINEFTAEIEEIELQIKNIMAEMNHPIQTIPGISYRMAAAIVAEIGDFSSFDSPDKILAYAGMDPSTYQSGQLNNSHAKMVKRGSKYLRYSLYIATRFVCLWDPTFAAYLAKKRAEGKHYNVAISHATKKLVRVMYHITKNNQAFRSAT